MGSRNKAAELWLHKTTSSKSMFFFLSFATSHDLLIFQTLYCLQVCTKRRAILSVLQHPKMQSSEPELRRREEEATRIVNEVWESCWNDTRPFDEVSRIDMGSFVRR